MAFAPPPGVVDAVESALPGVWHAFLGRAVEGVRQSGARVRLTSWYRNQDHNRSVGGHPDSQHLAGLAFDFVTDNPIGLEAALDRLGLVAVRERDHVHVQAYPAGAVTPLVRRLL